MIEDGGTVYNPYLELLDKLIDLYKFCITQKRPDDAELIMKLIHAHSIFRVKIKKEAE